ncbi:MAG: monofunctional biosynthetic peptidoglycan transglycosylase [Prevotellaceae bacterium]|jgi:monofunctional biosynthetic peptidoglycan transglycosylase|nr:monofunctional biosynthetic peptidoglycan transglycosylase [Prevotellaceae bacterium]
MRKKKILKKLAKIVLWTFVGFIILSVSTTLLYRWINPPVTPLMLIRKIELGAPINYKWVDIEKMPQSLINCAIAAEDNNFLSHGGVDFGAIEKAVEYNETHEKTRGASTITQQTAKNVFLWQSRTWVRKGLEVYFTFLIETFWSKERIMEVYLNVIEMGKGVYGAEAAAQKYFHCSAKKMSPYQSALIAASFPAPLKRNPAKPSGYLSGRANQILSLSYKIGKISFDDHSIEKAKERYKKRQAAKKKKQKKH